jgi:TolB-like protein/thioredoxin-like negative regulator of GroEL
LIEIWNRFQHHKVMHWTLAYAAAAYTLLHGVEMVSNSLSWPHIIARVVTLVLILGLPVVMTLAWYHGAKGLQRVSGPELAIITLLGIIAGSVLWMMARSTVEHSGEVASQVSVVAPSAAVPAATTSAAATAPRTAVAVLPFANLTGDASKEYLGDGMAEELINTLTKVPGLKIPSRTSSFAYKGRSTDLKQIARDLNVGAVIEGSVRAADKRIRITAQLIDAQTDVHLWSETYDEEFKDIFKLQDRLSAAIVKAMSASLNGAAPAAITTSQPTQDAEAYRLYLQGSYLGSRPSEENLNRAVDYFERAIVRDPRFARAYAGLAEAKLKLYNASPKEVEQAARRALELDPSLAMAHGSLSFVNYTAGQLLDVAAEFRAALAADSTDGEIRSHYAELFAAAGQTAKALTEIERAFSLAPTNPIVIGSLAGLYSVVGRDEDARKYADFSVELGMPKNDGGRASVYATSATRARRYTEAAELLISSDGPDSAHHRLYIENTKLVYAALADPSKRAEAMRAPGRLYMTADAPLIRNVVDAGLCNASSRQYVLLGAIDEAFRVANRCLDLMAPSGMLTVGLTGRVIWVPEMRAFRMDPRFPAFATRLGLMDYWQMFGPPDDCDLKDGKLTCH